MKRTLLFLLIAVITISALSSSVTVSATAINTPQTAIPITLDKGTSYTFKYGWPTHDWHDENLYENEIYYSFTPSATGYYEFEASGYDSTEYSVGKIPSVFISVKDSDGKSVFGAYTNETTLVTKKAAKLYEGEKYYIDLYDSGISYLSEYRDYDYGYAEETIKLIVRKHTHTYTVEKHKYSSYISAWYSCKFCDYYYSGSFYKPSSVTLSTAKYTYNGSVKKPSVTVKDSNGKKIDSSYYTVTYPSGRKNVGKYTVKVKFKKEYEEYGSLSKAFTIVPKSTTLSSVSGVKKGFTVKWKKQSTQTTGYQIQYATNSGFKSAKTLTVSSNKTTSKKVVKLNAKKKYYVRIRTYKTVSGTKYYSSWSAKKSVKTK